MKCRRPNLVARPLLVAFALSQVLAVAGLAAQPSAAVVRSPFCLDKDDPYWNGCRQGANEGWGVGAACRPKPVQSYGDPWNRFRHGYVDGLNSAYDAGLKDAGCPPIGGPIPADPDIPPPPPPPAQPDPQDEAKRAESEAKCSARVPATATPEERNRTMSACMRESGYAWTPPKAPDPADEAKRAEFEAKCSARVPATATPEERNRTMSACMRESGYAWTPPAVDTTPPAEQNPPVEQPSQGVDPQGEAKRAEIEAKCSARVPATATPEERNRTMSACLRESGISP
ncbi:hypothetical protein [Streptomyces sp. DSM 41634]|uniref:hypothetical protein n=1 Tax=Streptomyces sp. DSM 41634 TaxID=3448656 RepID=UPI004040247B